MHYMVFKGWSSTAKLNHKIIPGIYETKTRLQHPKESVGLPWDQTCSISKFWTGHEGNIGLLAHRRQMLLLLWVPTCLASLWLPGYWLYGRDTCSLPRTPVFDALALWWPTRVKYFPDFQTTNLRDSRKGFKTPILFLPWKFGDCKLKWKLVSFLNFEGKVLFLSCGTLDGPRWWWRPIT